MCQKLTNRTLMLTTLFCSTFLATTDFAQTQTRDDAKPPSSGSLSVFNRRILPILQSKNRSSCFDCHFSGVDLKDYIHESQEKTFASLRKAGMIDVKKPDDSKILEFIGRKPEKPNPISQKARTMEYEAFRAWIRAAVADPKLLGAANDTDAGLRVPVEVIRHARKDQVLSRFIDNVWSQMGRCVSCHAPGHNERIVKKFGERINWMVPNDPLATMQRIAKQDLIDLKNPEKSSFLLKPAGLVKHGGGPKFVPGSAAWDHFLQFLTDYAAVVRGDYAKTEQLPMKNAEIAYLSKHYLRLNGVDEKYHRMPVKIDIYRWENGRWSPQRWATAFGYVAGKRGFLQGQLQVTAPGNSPRADAIRKSATLPPGDYLAKVYIDEAKRLLNEPSYQLGEKEFVGQTELRGAWTVGFKTPRVGHAPKKLRR